MGFTRYWNRTDKPITPEFIDAVNEVIEDCKKRGIVLRQGRDNPTPLVTSTEIMFNGNSEKRLGCESFFIDNDNTGFNFCKTKGYPYDYAVRTVLEIAEKMGLVTNVSSDGKIGYVMSDDEFINVCAEDGVTI